MKYLGTLLRNICAPQVHLGPLYWFSLDNVSHNNTFSPLSHHTGLGCNVYHRT